MANKWFYAGICAFFICNAGFSCGTGCNVTTSCGFDERKDSKPVSDGCNTMKVTIHNQTNFTLSVDDLYKPSTTTGSTENFGDISPNSTETFTIAGVKIDDGDNNHDNDAREDEIDTSIRYVAKHQINGNDQKTGSQLVITLKKDSCNAKKAELNMSDFRCYYQKRIDNGNLGCKWGGCVLGNLCNDDQGTKTCYPNCAGMTEDAICMEDYDRFLNVECRTASDSLVTNAADNSSVATTSGLYTSGVNNAGDPDTSIAYSTSSKFQCNQSSECGPGKVGDLCKGGTSDYNEPAKLKFYVYASPIETLTITFPFNSQSPIAKLMRTTIYSNLSPKNLGGLGTYYSVTPVAVTDTTLAFSTLCNSASCPQP